VKGMGCCGAPERVPFRLVVGVGKEGVSRGLRPGFFVGRDVRAKARTYLRTNGKSNRRFLPVRLRSGCGMINKGIVVGMVRAVGVGWMFRDPSTSLRMACSCGGI